MKVDIFVIWMIGLVAAAAPLMVGYPVFQWQFWAIATPIDAVLVIIYFKLRSKEEEELRNTNH